jgi:hypothetical protein
MTEPTSAQELFRGRHFDQEIIVLCVRWYLTFKLSSRDLVQMMVERGIGLAHRTILRWVQRYATPVLKAKANGTSHTVSAVVIAAQLPLIADISRNSGCPLSPDACIDNCAVMTLVRAESRRGDSSKNR